MITQPLPTNFHQAASRRFDVAFNHDGFGLLDELYDTPREEADVDKILIRPLADSSITLLDWCIKTTGMHNCQTRHGKLFEGQGPSDLDRRIGDVVQHYAAHGRDLLDLVLELGHRAGLKVFGNVRLNHTSRYPEALLGCPGRNAEGKKDFRDPVFHQYLCEIFEDLLAKGVDGISLDFERKAPFFPSDATPQERFQACMAFLTRVRALTDKPILARVSYQAEKGSPQGQDPERWMREGLVNIIVPSTHNHDPDPLDWEFDRFLKAAAESPPDTLVWPQIWPTPVNWGKVDGHLHPPEAILRRVEEIRAAGADGVYFFNFCCFGSRSNVFDTFRKIPRENPSDVLKSAANRPLLHPR